jgi:hypothetical protein
VNQFDRIVADETPRKSDGLCRGQHPICFCLFLKFVPLGGNRPQVFAKKSGTQLQIKCSYFSFMTLQLFQEPLNIADLCLFLPRFCHFGLLGVCLLLDERRMLGAKNGATVKTIQSRGKQQ